MRTLKNRILIPLLNVAVLALIAGCGGGNQPELPRDVAKASPAFDLASDGRTDKPSQVDALPGSGYIVEPLITVGDQIPFYKGDFPSVSVDKSEAYGLTGIPDGSGVLKHGSHYFVLLNHEVAPGGFSNYSTTIAGQINGARVSLLLFNKDWEVLGGRNLIEKIWDGSTQIGSVTLDSKNTQVTQSGTVLNRFCSSTLSEIYSQPLYFTGEEATNGRGFTVDLDGNARLINGLPRFAYENVVPVSKYAGETVAVALDDTADRYLVLYTGDEAAGNDGYNSGKSYVGRVLVGGVPAVNSAPLALNSDYTVEWVEVPQTYDFDGAGPNPAQNLYTATAPFYNWAGSIAKATQFKRPEDGHESVQTPGEIHWVTTGSGPSAPSYDTFGSIWKLTLANGSATANATLRLTATGSATGFMTPDNVTADSFGNFWIQEDPTGGSQNTMLAQGRTSSIYRAPLGSGSAAYVRLMEVNQNKAPFTAFGIPSFAANPWETSGIVEWGAVNGDAAVLFDVQAHGYPAPGYVESGQLLIAYKDGDDSPGQNGGFSP
jgi:glycerophosphoryl diester phosphodiesterase